MNGNGDPSIKTVTCENCGKKTTIEPAHRDCKHCGEKATSPPNRESRDAAKRVISSVLSNYPFEKVSRNTHGDTIKLKIEAGGPIVMDAETQDGKTIEEIVNRQTETHHFQKDIEDDDNVTSIEYFDTEYRAGSKLVSESELNRLRDSEFILLVRTKQN